MNTSKIILVLLTALLFLQGCAERNDPPELTDPDLTILYTNDEHGWISDTDDADGAANLMGVWKEDEGYTEAGSFLVLSGGDNWTGQAISTWFQGESTVEVMNAMGYDAAAIGNHEFDFQVSGLMARMEQADFPFLSANMRNRSDGEVPDFIQPYTVVEVNDILVGIVGLTTTTTSYTTFPTYVEDYTFIGYEQALAEWVPQIWAEGVEIVLCVAHICGFEMSNIVPLAKDLGISMIGGGHCNELISDVRGNGNVALIEGGWGMRNYARLDIWYDPDEMLVTELQAMTRPNQGGSPDPVVESVVSHWEDATNTALGEVI